MRLYLVRHPETTFNADSNRYCGRTDAGLSPRGNQQSRSVAEYFLTQDFHGVWCSPLTRSLDTATVLGRQKGVPVHVEPGFIEMDFGLWEGLTPQEIEARDPQLWRQWRAGDPAAAPPGGESLEQVFNRTMVGLEKLTSVLGADDSGVVIGHNMINRLLLTHIVGIPYHRYRTFHQDNGSITCVERGTETAMWIVRFMNLTPERKG